MQWPDLSDDLTDILGTDITKMLDKIDQELEENGYEAEEQEA